jgi:UDP-glucose 4-epimerase
MASIKNAKVFVSGGAGFVGSHIADRLVKHGNEVIVYDNLSSGNKKFLKDSLENITFIKGDLLDKKKLTCSLKGVDYVFHMAANADIKDNLSAPEKCLEQNTIATSNLLEAMRTNNVRKIAFASTGSVYGEPLIHPTPEDAPFPTQTSMYGASKLACEGLLEAYSVGYGYKVSIFRFVSLMGERYTHGCVFDFYKKMRENPKELLILGNGKQRKSYLYIKDCVDAMFKAIDSSKQDLRIYNLGHDDYMGVTAIADIVCRELGLEDVKYRYSGGERGWVGDSPFIHLDITKIKSLGWKPTKTIPECVKTTVSWLKDNEWIFDERK